MAKWVGKIGYAVSTETKPGVWTEGIIDRDYYGDLIRNTRRRESSGNLNDNINISNEISILADEFAISNSHLIRYAEFMGAKWNVTNITIERPRLKLTLGGVYNG
jgi:hypothetical protein